MVKSNLSDIVQGIRLYYLDHIRALTSMNNYCRLGKRLSRGHASELTAELVRPFSSSTAVSDRVLKYSARVRLMLKQHSIKLLSMPFWILTLKADP